MNGRLSDFHRKLLGWYDAHRRDLPWRAAIGQTAALDPYHVLVSEAMLQQTQVATVIPYFRRFIEQFPTIQTLTDADTQAVLRAWQGLGYYSRARNLQKAAATIIADFAGKVPETVEELLTLPGVGRYTAGAVSSLAFGHRAPILDGNVARVLCRLDAIQDDPRDPTARQLLWARAEQVLPSKRLADFNSALMELGALVCTPRSPQCLICPCRNQCGAFASGLVDQIPPPKKSKPIPQLQRWTFCIRNGDRYLIEQRPATGRWAGMWQFVTIEPNGIKPSPNLLQSLFKLRTSSPKWIGTIEHALTHRRYQFQVFACVTKETIPAQQWISLAEIDKYPLPRPHVKVVEILSKRIER